MFLKALWRKMFASNRIDSWTAFLSLICMQLIASPASAWTLSPMKIDKDMKPGQTLTDVLVVDNAGASDNKRFEVKIVDWSLDEMGELLYFEPGKIKESLATKLVCTPMQFKAAPSERKMLRFTLNLPPDLSPGEHTVGIQVLEVVIPPKDQSTGKINVGVSVKCGFLCAMTIVVPKAQPAQLEPLALDLNQQKALSTVNFKIRNSANVRSRPTWRFAIKDQVGKTVFQSDTEQIVLRETDRIISIPIQTRIEPGKYKIEGKLDQGLSYPVQEIEKAIDIQQAIEPPAKK